MSILIAVALAIVEGAAGILLLSGDGHLLIFEKLLGTSEQPLNFLYFAVILHLGNLIAVLVYYRQEALRLFIELLKLLHIVKTPRREKQRLTVGRRELLMLLIALIPMLLSIALIGHVRSIYAGETTLLFVGASLFISGVFLFISERLYRGSKDEKSITPLDVLLIGLAQAVSVLPGISRAAVTVGTGVMRGLKRDYAVCFSCLLSVPVILAALITESVAAHGSAAAMPSLWICLLGVAVSAAVSFLALKLLSRIAKYGRLDNLAYWCWGAGILSLALMLIT